MQHMEVLVSELTLATPVIAEPVTVIGVYREYCRARLAETTSDLA
jgi:hypothetical protein